MSKSPWPAPVSAMTRRFILEYAGDLTQCHPTESCTSSAAGGKHASVRLLTSTRARVAVLLAEVFVVVPNIRFLNRLWGGGSEFGLIHVGGHACWVIEGGSLYRAQLKADRASNVSPAAKHQPILLQPRNAASGIPTYPSQRATHNLVPQRHRSHRKYCIPVQHHKSKKQPNPNYNMMS